MNFVNIDVVWFLGGLGLTLLLVLAYYSVRKMTDSLFIFTGIVAAQLSCALYAFVGEGLVASLVLQTPPKSFVLGFLSSRAVLNYDYTSRPPGQVFAMVVSDVIVGVAIAVACLLIARGREGVLRFTAAFNLVYAITKLSWLTSEGQRIFYWGYKMYGHSGESAQLVMNEWLVTQIFISSLLTILVVMWAAFFRTK